MRACFVVLLVALPALAGGVALSMSADVQCVDEASLRARLSAAGLQPGLTGAIDVDLSQSEAGLRLRARRSDGRLFVRTIPLRGGCEGIEAAVATLIREWSRPGLTPSDADAGARPIPPPRRTAIDLQASDAGAVEGAPPAPPTGGTSEVADAGRGGLKGMTPLGDGGEPDAGALESRGEVSAPTRESVLPSTMDASVERPAGPATPSTDAGTPSPTDGLELRAGLGGGLHTIPGTLAVATGAVTIEAGSRGWGGSVEFALNGDGTLTQAGLEVSLQSQVLTVAARRRLTWRRLALDLGLGLRGTRLVVTPRGLERSTPTTLLSGGPVVLTTGWLRLFDPVHAFLRLSAGLRLPAEALVIVNGPSFGLGIVQLSAIAGLAIAWP